ncbi:hypothetical protein F2Q70_00003222 [Brassica cretica]|uniref:Uncharacterized protein n=1 Tax=Brassica cretica TaxID=69181 RepID=A0A8S9IN52_BRACR|nr:hypothetical protein F2Q70_00003222 [Brassica cretica]
MHLKIKENTNKKREEKKKECAILYSHRSSLKIGTRQHRAICEEIRVLKSSPQEISPQADVGAGDSSRRGVGLGNEQGRTCEAVEPVMG